MHDDDLGRTVHLTDYEKSILKKIVGETISISAVHAKSEGWIKPIAGEAYAVTSPTCRFLIVPRVCGETQEDWNRGPLGIIDCTNTLEADTACFDMVEAISSFPVHAVHEVQYIEDEGEVFTLGIRLSGATGALHFNAQVFHIMAIFSKPEDVASLAVGYLYAGVSYIAIR